MRTALKGKGYRSSKRASALIHAAVERIEERVLMSAFQPGDLLVYRVGTGSAALSSASTAVFIDEYTPAGTLVQSIALPTATSGANNPLTASGTATSEGNLTLSQNGQNLILGGYDAVPGVASIASTNASNTLPITAVATASGTTSLSVASTAGMTTSDAITLSNLSGVTLSPSQSTYFAFVASTSKISLYTTAANATAHGTTGAVTNTGTYGGGATINDATMTIASREIGIVSPSGTFDTTTTLGSALSANNIRGAASVDGVGNVYAAGPGGAVLTTVGSTVTATTIDPTDNVRSIEINNGQLYAASSTGATALLGTIGSGLPGSGPLTISQLPGITGSSTSGAGLGGAYEFAFATLNPGDTGPDTLYVADNFNDGVDKFSLVNGSWVLNGEIGAFGSGGNVLAGITGIAAEPVQGGEQLFISSAGSSGTAGTLYTITDTFGYNAAGGTTFSAVPPLTAVATAATSQAFRGIAFVPQPGGAPTIFANPTAQTAVAGTNATFTSSAFGVNVAVQWQVNTGDGTGFNNIAGANFTTLTVPSVAQSQNGFQYRAVFTNGSGTITSAAAALTVIPGPAFNFSTTTYTSPNTVGTATITVHRAGDSSAQDTINYTTSDGTAKAGTNYTAESGTLTFPAGSTADQTFTVPLSFVAGQTGPLSFNITLSNVVGSNSATAVIGSPASFTITSPVESVGLAGSVFTGAVTNATNATPIVITTASTAGMVSGQSVTISGVLGNTHANGTYFVSVLNSTSFSLFTNAALTTGDAGNGAYTSGGTWTDISAANFTVNDMDATVMISAVRTGSFTRDAGTVPFSYSGAVSGSGSFSFAAGQLVSAASITLPAATSSNQSISVSLASPLSGFATGGAILGTFQTGSITDVHAAATTLSGAAGSTSDIETSGTFGNNFAPVVGDTSGTGNFGFLSYEVLEFSPGASPGIYPTLGSTVNAGGISSLSLQLFNTDASGSLSDQYNGHPGNFNVYFLPDSDTTTPTSKLTFSTTAVPSGLASSQFSAAPVLIGTFSFNNTAGYDTYTPVAIPASVENALVADLNGGASFRLAVTPETNGLGATDVRWGGSVSGQSPILSLAAAQTVNQTPEFISFQNPTYSVSESAGSATITLTRSGSNISDSATVNYATSNGTAIAGTNYTSSTGTATLAAGSPTASFTVPITDVSNQGGDKTLNLALSNPATGGPGTIGGLASPATASLTIADASNAPTETLGSTPLDAGDIEVNGPFTDAELKATDVSGDFPSYSAIDFTASAPTNPVTGIDSIALTLTNRASVAAGPVDFYLVSDNTSNILPSSPQSKNPHFYDSTQGIEGFGSQFGTAMLLGSYNLTDTTGGDVLTIPLLNYSPATEAALIKYINASSSPANVIRILITPENGTVDADWVSTSAAISLKVQEAPAPTVTGLSPASGPAAGGTSVIINGTGFTGATAVDFGSTPATSFTINSTGTQITALDPAGSGTVDVTVVGASGGVSATSAADQFTYTASAVSVTSVVLNGNNPALAGVQRSMVDSIVYTFNQAVTLAATNAFAIALNAGYAAGTLPTLTWAAINPNVDGSSTQWAVTFSGASVLNGSIADGVYNITINGAAITADSNPTLTGTSRTDTFFRLFGDATGAGNVIATDYNALLSTFNLKTTAPGYLAYFNEDGASKIDAPNYNAFLTNFGKRFKNVTSITTI